MTDHYEDEDENRQRVLSNRQVLGFISRYWLRTPWLLTGTVVLTLIAIGFDLALPWAAGRLVVAVTAGLHQRHRRRRGLLASPRQSLRRIRPLCGSARDELLAERHHIKTGCIAHGKTSDHGHPR
jgi:hypothetical protein